EALLVEDLVGVVGNRRPRVVVEAAEVAKVPAPVDDEVALDLIDLLALGILEESPGVGVRQMHAEIVVEIRRAAEVPHDLDGRFRIVRIDFGKRPAGHPVLEIVLLVERGLTGVLFGRVDVSLRNRDLLVRYDVELAAVLDRGLYARRHDVDVLVDVALADDLARLWL